MNRTTAIVLVLALAILGAPHVRASGAQPGGEDDDLAPLTPENDDFTAALDGYGEWIWVDGREAFVPYVDEGWRPYLYGYWAWTPFGWYWVSYEPWGYYPSHYGSWGWYDAYGWCWFRGYDFRACNVHWHSWRGHRGWCPRGTQAGPRTLTVVAERDFAEPNTHELALSASAVAQLGAVLADTGAPSRAAIEATSGHRISATPVVTRVVPRRGRLIHELAPRTARSSAARDSAATVTRRRPIASRQHDSSGGRTHAARYRRPAIAARHATALRPATARSTPPRLAPRPHLRPRRAPPTARSVPRAAPQRASPRAPVAPRPRPAAGHLKPAPAPPHAPSARR